MENLQTSYGTKSPWLRDDDPLYPCPTVAERHKLYCYLMVTSRILDVDRRRLAEDGRLVPQGRAGMGRHVLPVARARRLRPVAPEPSRDPEHLLARRQAWRGSAYTAPRGTSRAWTPAARRSAAFCLGRRRRAREYCFNGIGTILGGFCARRRTLGAPPAGAQRRRRTGTTASSARAPSLRQKSPRPRRGRARGRSAPSPSRRRHGRHPGGRRVALSVSPPAPPSRMSDPGPPVSRSLPASPQIVLRSLRYPRSRHSAPSRSGCSQTRRPAEPRALAPQTRNGRRLVEDPRSAPGSRGLRVPRSSLVATSSCRRAHPGWRETLRADAPRTRSTRPCSTTRCRPETGCRTSLYM